MKNLSCPDDFPRKWRIIEDGEHAGSMNMARDVALAYSVARGSDPVLRLYRFKPACITIGRFQSVDDGIDSNLCSRTGIDIARRPTGGLAILHKNDFTYSVSLPACGTGKGVRDYYFDTIAKGILCALESLGISAQVVRHSTNRRKSAWCFDGVIGIDIKYGDRKICGSAQKIFDKSVLQHGSLFLELDSWLYSELTASSVDEQADGRASIISLKEAGEKTLSWNDVRDAFESGFSKALQIEIAQSEFSVEEEKTANELHLKLFGRDNWTLTGEGLKNPDFFDA